MRPDRYVGEIVSSDRTSSLEAKLDGVGLTAIEKTALATRLRQPRVFHCWRGQALDRTLAVLAASPFLRTVDGSESQEMVAHEGQAN